MNKIKNCIHHYLITIEDRVEIGRCKKCGHNRQFRSLAKYSYIPRKGRAIGREEDWKTYGGTFAPLVVDREVE